MTRNDFFNLLVPYLDGELSEEDVRRFEDHVAKDEEARAIVEYERRLSTFVGGALEESADPGAKLRVLRAFRDQTSAPAAGPPAGRKISWGFGIPAAAAVILGLMWAGGLFGGDASGPLEHQHRQPASHRGVVERVLVSYEDFQERVETKRRPGDSYMKTIAETLANEDDHRLWDAAGKPSEANAEARRLLSSCLQRNVDMPTIPERFKMLGFRRTKLDIKGHPFPVPHIIFESEGDDLSMYVLCGSTADAVERELKLNEGKGVKSLHGCSACGIIARRYGNVLLLFVSGMPFNRIREVAEKM